MLLVSFWEISDNYLSFFHTNVWICLMFCVIFIWLFLIFWLGLRLNCWLVCWIGYETWEWGKSSDFNFVDPIYIYSKFLCLYIFVYNIKISTTIILFVFWKLYYQTDENYDWQKIFNYHPTTFGFFFLTTVPWQIGAWPSTIFFRVWL